MKIRSDFALLDVLRGRGRLRKHFGVNKEGHRTRAASNQDPIPVVIHGEIVGVWGGDDGTSQEFEVRVAKVVVHEQG